MGNDEGYSTMKEVKKINREMMQYSKAKYFVSIIVCVLLELLFIITLVNLLASLKQPTPWFALIDILVIIVMAILYGRKKIRIILKRERELEDRFFYNCKILVEHDDGKIRVTKNVIIVMKEKPGNFQFSYGKYIGWETGPIDTAFKLITFQGVYVRAIKDNPFYICPIKSKDKNYQRIHML